MPSFPDTSWTAVCQAQQDDPEAARQALTRLLRDYAPAVLAYVRRFGVPERDLEDVTQSFMTYFFLEGLPGSGADPNRGRFRGYLCGALRHFLLNWRSSQRAAKRHPGRPIVSLEELRRSSGSLPVADPSATPEQAFDRQWGREVLARAVQLTRQQLTTTGRDAQWAVFCRIILDEGPEVTYRVAAEELGMSEAQVTNRLFAAKEVFRRALRTVVADTVESRTEIEAELRELAAVFR